MTEFMLLFSIGALTACLGDAGVDDNMNTIQLHITEDQLPAVKTKCGTCNGCYILESNACRDRARYPAASEKSCVHNGGLWCDVWGAGNESSLSVLSRGLQSEAHGDEVGLNYEMGLPAEMVYGGCYTFVSFSSSGYEVVDYLSIQDSSPYAYNKASHPYIWKIVSGGTENSISLQDRNSTYGLMVDSENRARIDFTTDIPSKQDSTFSVIKGLLGTKASVSFKKEKEGGEYYLAAEPQRDGNGKRLRYNGNLEIKVREFDGSFQFKKTASWEVKKAECAP